MPPIPTARSMGRSSNGYGNGIYGIPHDEAEHFDENGEKTPLHQDAYSSRSVNNEPTKGWDVFVVTPSDDEDETLSSKWIEVVLKGLKIVTYFITFFIVLLSAVASKGIVLFMTSVIRPNRTVALCSQSIPGLERDKKYQAVFVPDDPERIVWIWALFFVLIIPEVMTLFRAARICVFKSYRRPTKATFLIVLIAETLHTVGVVTLVFVILPSLDVIKGAMLTNCLCFIPAVLALFSRHSSESKRAFKTILDLLSVLAQLAGLIIWPLVANEERNKVSWYIPAVCVLISVGWWENYVDRNSPFAFIRKMSTIKQKLQRTRYFTYIFISIWKILLIFVSMVVCLYLVDGNARAVFSKFSQAFQQHKIFIQRDKSDLVNFANTDQFIGIEGETFEINSRPATPIWFIFAQVVATWLCYVVGKFACKICIQGFSFAFPLSLTVPITISALIALCGLHFEDKCKLSDYFIPKYLFWYCHEEPFIRDEPFFNIHAIMWLIWLLSQTWIAIHIWTPKCERLATTEKLFINPMYSAVIIDQSMALNRRRDDEEEIKSEELNLEADDGLTTQDASQHYETISEHMDDKKKANAYNKDYIVRIFACATMWHETAEEMIQMLKSVMRMDEDQSARRNAQKYLRIVDPDYYEFEVNIFFDDAFELCDENDEDMVVNRFVKQLVEVIDTAASNVHQCNIRLKPPKKYPTPYGGRLEWTMPGQNKLVAHLKDKIKIRHRKRWSQCMYMYYLLGHRLMEQNIDVNRKAVMAENTYILTLDGDINFRPHAVQLLVDLMKKNKSLGAACGRIHPVGSGLMPWYQKFEYAIGHWLQKATEHMIGCVLCSPGCFSLFRAKALMDDNVMRRYTAKSEEALHYVQYDQGEDRWLCTLLLQRGYRVEYSAASDAYTHCPEGFGEFYTQRRRWAPSTMANIMDLLGDYKRTIKVNDHISFPYIIYQGMLMIGTILGPGTIFLMLVGAMVAVFRISNWNSFYLNLIPILFFIIVCFSCKNEIQIFVAQIMSAAYALLMMAVFVGQAIQMTEDGIGSPSAVFFLSLSGSFVIAALLHPQEFSCLGPAFLYLLSIPCMYLLLIIYSLINLNVVSWGTREVQTKKTKKEIEEEKKAQEQLKKSTLLGFLNIGDGNKEEGSISFNLANLVKCMFCTYPKPNKEAVHLLKIQGHLDDINQKISSLEKTLDPMAGMKRKTSAGRTARFSDNLSTVTENEEDDNEFASEMSEANEDRDSTEPTHQRDDLLNPYWIEDKSLKNGEVAYLHPSEIQFWKDLIEKYLFPLDQNKEHEARIANELKELRNRVVFAFFMLNALFILVVFLLQLNKDILHVDWPFGVRENITINPDTNEYIVEKEFLEMEPIGLVFVVFFGIILVIQFVGMLFHRFGTLSHILASVELSCCSQKIEDISDDAFIDRNAVQIARQLQRLKGLNEEDDKSDDSKYGNRLEKRKTIFNLEKRRQQQNRIGTLDVAFRKRFMNISTNIAEAGGTPVLGGIRNKETLHALERRRNTVIAGEQSKTGMQTLGAKNEFVRNKNRSTLDSKRPFPNGRHSSSGVHNKAYIDASSDEDHDADMQMNVYNGSRRSINNSLGQQSYRDSSQLV